MNEILSILKPIVPFLIYHFIFNVYYYLSKRKVSYKILIVPVLLAGIYIFYPEFVVTLLLVSSAALFLEKKYFRNIPILNKIFASAAIYFILFRNHDIFVLLYFFIADYLIEYITVVFHYLKKED